MVGPSSTISKIMLFLLVCLICFYISMDIGLYLRVQNYSIDRSLHFNVTRLVNPVGIFFSGNFLEKSTDLAVHAPLFPATYNSSNDNYLHSKNIPAETRTFRFSENNIQSYRDHTLLSCNINPLCHVTVKALLLDHTNHYIFAPLATLLDDALSLSQYSSITPNKISLFHVFVACISGKLISSDSLKLRRLGVLFFELRTFLDDLDGHVARAKKHIRGERSEIGTSGYYIDGLCDSMGCIALLIGIFIFLKRNPPRRQYSHFSTKAPEPILIYRVKPITRKIVKKVMSFSGQLLLSSTAWNRYIAVYQNMLEHNIVTDYQFKQQNIIFKSNWFFGVAWIWRIMNVHSLLHCALLSIFCDKLWDFLKVIQYFGYLILLVAICVSEIHILEAHKQIFSSIARL